MSTLDAFLRSWPAAPWLAAALLAYAGIYTAGWRALRARDPARWTFGRLTAFWAGLAALYLVFASPLEPFSSLLLSVHMVQHLLLMLIVPPLVWLGWPLLPIVRGLTTPVRTYWVAPFLRIRTLRSVFAVLTHPPLAWVLFVLSTWLWHLPAGYELGLASDNWHVVQHACFLAGGMLFWYPVVSPYPSRPRWPRWFVFPYLLLADVQNTLLAAWLTFSPRLLYPHYERVPPLPGLSPLDDQRTAGVLMWVPGSIGLLAPLVWITVNYLRGHDRVESSLRRMRERSRPRTRHVAFDLLNAPLVGSFLRWRYARRALQFMLAALAVLVIYDGLQGPQIAPMNLAGVLPWIHWRGVLVLVLLVVGNFFCMACPFTLPRSLACRWMPGGRPWPRWLRNKWLAVALVALFLWSYEACALWDSPWVTAWIAIGYFVAAFVIDTIFMGAAFCKYVCPIGQFNFVQSLVSPLEVGVRSPDVCATCTTKECIRGNLTSPGCELQLLQPHKVGNLDCTFCLDCVHACPHENVGVLAAVPGRTLWIDPIRSGLGRLSRRPDVAALVALLVFGAFANAAGMIEPVVAWQNQLRVALGGVSRVVMTTASYAFTVVVLPLLCVTMAAAVSRRLAGQAESTLRTATRFAFALVPIGSAMWLAHYSLHLFTSWETIVPATQRFAADRGWTGLGNPLWQCSCCQDAAAWIPYVELLMLDVGLLASLYAALRIAEVNSKSSRQALAALLPWAALIVLLFAFGVWIVFQPMEMRGTMLAGG